MNGQPDWLIVLWRRGSDYGNAICEGSVPVTVQKAGNPGGSQKKNLQNWSRLPRKKREPGKILPGSIGRKLRIEIDPI